MHWTRFSMATCSPPRNQAFRSVKEYRNSDPISNFLWTFERSDNATHDTRKTVWFECSDSRGRAIQRRIDQEAERVIRRLENRKFGTKLMLVFFHPKGGFSGFWSCCLEGWNQVYSSFWTYSMLSKLLLNALKTFPKSPKFWFPKRLCVKLPATEPPPLPLKRPNPNPTSDMDGPPKSKDN